MNKNHASLRVGLSSNSITILRTSGWLRRRRDIVANYSIDISSPLQMRADMDKALADPLCAGLPTTVVLADGWTRLFLVTPPIDAVCLEDCRAAAARRFQLLYGDSPTQWLIEADWNAKHPFLACALPRSIPTTLMHLADSYKLKLLGIAPQFVVGWNQWRRAQRSDSWFGTVHQNDITLGAVSQGRLIAIRRLQVASADIKDRRCFLMQIQREALKLSLPPPSSIALCGQFPQEWTTIDTDGIAIISPEDSAAMHSDLRIFPGADLAATGELE